MCECEEKETFDIMINVRSFTIKRQLTLYLANHVKILMEEVLSLCQAFMVVQKLMY